MTGKAKIVGLLGESGLLLPDLVHEALAANDRAKFRMTLLQAACAAADAPDLPAPDLRPERTAAGVEDTALDELAALCRRGDEPGAYVLSGAADLLAGLVGDLRTMVRPLTEADAREVGDGGSAQELVNRLEALENTLPDWSSGRITRGDVHAIATVAPERGDSAHRLVMDLHKELNRIQSWIYSESIDGARIYGLQEEDRPLVAAFMQGLNRTARLRFDHPGLATTATRTGGRLVIQNDIGTTDAHVLVVHVEGLRTSVTYTDVHIQRLVFFQNLFERFDVQWSDTRSRVDRSMESDVYHLCLGTFGARDARECERFLSHLGSRVVFLIDWNKARKRLRRLVRKPVAREVLRWAAEHDCGHMGFLRMGGEQLVFDALQDMRESIPPGARLSDLLGESEATEFLKFTLSTCAGGLLDGRSESLIRDRIRAELRTSIDTVLHGLIDVAADHAAQIVELATVTRDILGFGCGDQDRDLAERTARRAKVWEHRADQLVVDARRRAQADPDGRIVSELVRVADDAADELEEAAFLLTLPPAVCPPASALGSLQQLAEAVLLGAREYLKALRTARLIQRGGSRSLVEDFLQAIDGTGTQEHEADDAQRRSRADVLVDATDFRQLVLLQDVAERLEESADALRHAALILRDHVLGDVLAH